MAFNVLKGWNMDEFRELVGFGDPEKMLLFLQRFELIATKKSCRTCHALARNAEKVQGKRWTNMEMFRSCKYICVCTYN